MKWKERKEMEWNGLVVPKRVECMCELDVFLLLFDEYMLQAFVFVLNIRVCGWKKERVQNSDNVNMKKSSRFRNQCSIVSHPIEMGLSLGFLDCFFLFSWLRENFAEVTFCCDCMGGKIASFDRDDFFYWQNKSTSSALFRFHLKTRKQILSTKHCLWFS